MNLEAQQIAALNSSHEEFPGWAFQFRSITLIGKEKMSRFKTSGEFEIESVRYDWTVRHYAGASTPYENLRGISASVWLQEKKAKELIVDFPLRDYWFEKPRSTAAFVERLQRCIRGAIELGWKPESRGKPFRVRSEDVEGVPIQ